MKDSVSRRSVLTWGLVGILVIAMGWAVFARQGDADEPSGGAVSDAQAEGSGGTEGESAQTTAEGSQAESEGAPEVSQDSTDEVEVTANPEAVPPVVVKDLAPEALPEELASLVGEESESGVAADLVEPLVAVHAEVLSNPAVEHIDETTTVARGAMLDTLLAQALEFEENGWAQEGAPTVVASELTSLDSEGEPPTAEILVCLDHSGVDVVDASGRSLKDPDAPSRVNTIYQLQYLEGRWVAIYQTFPVDTAC